MNDLHTIQLAGGRTPPREFRIWAYGPVKTSKYPAATLDPEGAAEAVKRAAAHGIELSIDYEHAAVGPATGQPAPAAGWFALEARQDGLWAVNVRWTERASSMLAAAEYRHFSPVYRLDEKRRIVEVVNLALTNLPATVAQAPLVAAKAEAVILASQTSGNALLVETLAQLFTAAKASTLSACIAWIDRVSFLEEASIEARIASVVDAGIAKRKLRANQRSTFMELGRSVGADRLAETITTLESAEGASIAGRIPPARRGVWERAAEQLGSEWLASAVDGLATHGDDAPILGPDTGAAMAGIHVDDELAAELKRFGLTPADYIKQKQAELVRKREP
jgi:phage I-like protein